jgi:hypothetical protein
LSTVWLNGTRKKAFSARACLAFNSPMPQKRVSFKACQRQAKMALLALFQNYQSFTVARPPWPVDTGSAGGFFTY